MRFNSLIRIKQTDHSSGFNGEDVRNDVAQLRDW
jgi:hypothetical protein